MYASIPVIHDLGEERLPIASAAMQLGKLGGAARLQILTVEQRAKIATKAVAGRWEFTVDK